MAQTNIFSGVNGRRNRIALITMIVLALLALGAYLAVRNNWNGAGDFWARVTNSRPATSAAIQAPAVTKDTDMTAETNNGLTVIMIDNVPYTPATDLTLESGVTYLVRKDAGGNRYVVLDNQLHKLIKAMAIAPTAAPVVSTTNPTNTLTIIGNTTNPTGTLTLGNGNTAQTSECNPTNHSAQVAKFNNLVSSKGIAAALQEMGVTGNLSLLTDQDTYVRSGNQITGVKFYPSSNLSVKWPMVLATPNKVTGAEKTVDIGGGNFIYKGGVLENNGGGVIWISGYNWPEFCGAQPSGQNNIQLGNGNPMAGTTSSYSGTITFDQNLVIGQVYTRLPFPSVGRFIETGTAKTLMALDVQRLETESGDSFVRRIAGTVVNNQQVTETLDCEMGSICTVTHPNGDVQVYIGMPGLKLVEIAMTSRIVASFPANDKVFTPCALAQAENVFGQSEDPAFPARAGNFICANDGSFKIIEVSSPVNANAASNSANASAVTCPVFGGVQLVSIENGKACKLYPDDDKRGANEPKGVIDAKVPTGWHVEYWDGSSILNAKEGDSIKTADGTFRHN